MRALALALIVSTASPAVAQQALVGATVIDGNGRSTDDGIVEVRGDRIVCVGTAEECPLASEVERVDVGGAYITPGLIDAHVHFAQTGWLDGRPDANPDPILYPYADVVASYRADPGRWHRSYLCSGVTAVFDVGGAPWTVTDPHATDTERPDRAHVRAAGPLITHAGLNALFMPPGMEDQPTFMAMDSVAQIEADVAKLSAMGASAVKVWFLQPSTERREELDALLMAVGAAAKAHDLPLIVHATEIREAKMALKAGAKMLVHSVDDEPVDDEFIALLKANDAFYAPTITVIDQWRRALASVAFAFPVEIDDPNRCVDEALLDRVLHPERLTEALLARDGFSRERLFDRFKALGRQEARIEANLRRVRDAGGRIVLATDAGNPLTLHGPSVYGELEAMEAAGMTPNELVTAATIEAARSMGMGDEIGSLEAGKIADLLVLAEDPRLSSSAFRSVTHVMRAGELKTQEELQVR